jgi:hypothetical protein
MRNRPPVAAADEVTTHVGQSVVVDVLKNDSDPDGDHLIVASVTTPANGEAVLLTGGQVEYRPKASFFGTDSFSYTIQDGRGGQATAKVAVTVKLEPPRFLRRSGPASLSEMMQQPPTTPYGSSINAFVYVDEDGHVAEVVVTGHADSLTCKQTSGAIMGALLTKEPNGNDFLVAGSSRVLGGESTEVEQLRSDPDVQQFVALAAELQEAKILDQADGERGRDVLKRLQDAERNPKIRAFLSGQQANSVMAGLLRELSRISQSSGLVHLHKLPASLRERVSARILAAVESRTASLVEFRDLLPEATAEAALMVPLISTRTGQPITIDVPAGEFSKDGFSEAVREHRGALETAILGNARNRADLASQKMQELRDQAAACKRESPREKERIVSLNERCTQDSCYRVTTGAKVSRGEYCATYIPRNMQISQAWLNDANEIISKVEAEHNKSGQALDSFTHAALIDSMLRDWALPVTDLQAAFDHWRLQRRTAAWESLTRELDRLGIGRQVLSGENMVFVVGLEADRLRVRPMMVVDLRRSTVVADPKVGATAVIDLWGDRVQTAAKSEKPQEPMSLESLNRSHDVLRRRLERDPAGTMQAIFSLWTQELHRPEPDREQRLAKAREIGVLQRAAYVEEVVATTDAAGYADWKERISHSVILVREGQYASPEVIVRAALSIAKRAVAKELQSASVETPAAWHFLTSAATNVALDESKRGPGYADFEKTFDVSPTAIINDLIEVAKKRDAHYVAALLEKGGWPEHSSAMEQRLAATRNLAQGRIDLEISATEEMGNTLKQHGHLLAAQRAIQIDSGRTVWRLVRDRITMASKIETYDELTSQLNRLGNRIDEIRGNQPRQDAILRAQISGELQRLSSALIGMAGSQDRDAAGVRYSPDHEKLSARLAFEDGRYVDSLKRSFSEALPVALSWPNIAWRVLPDDFRGVPEELSTKIDGANVVISARRGETWLDVLHLRGVDPKEAKEWSDGLVKSASLGWSDAELVSEQILTRPVPVRPTLGRAAGVLAAPEVWPAVLKAMVYGCVPPAMDLVETSGRCFGNTSTSELHDRVSEQGEEFRPISADEVRAVSEQRFVSK